eukprot:augustus_masked-scaffold_4-processed-gene-18.0-mRNA-1 protein AED:0.66 eAED:0.66 QI:0/-1/0/1/-1/1/1/0/927
MFTHRQGFEKSISNPLRLSQSQNLRSMKETFNPMRIGGSKPSGSMKLGISAEKQTGHDTSIKAPQKQSGAVYTSVKEAELQHFRLMERIRSIKSERSVYTPKYPKFDVSIFDSDGEDDLVEIIKRPNFFHVNSKEEKRLINHEIEDLSSETDTLEDDTSSVEETNKTSNENRQKSSSIKRKRKKQKSNQRSNLNTSRVEQKQSIQTEFDEKANEGKNDFSMESLLEKAAIFVQASFRGYLGRRRARERQVELSMEAEILENIVKLQAAGRVIIAVKRSKRKVKELRQLMLLTEMVLNCQKNYRMKKAIQQRETLKLERTLIRVQATVRMFLQMCRYRRLLEEKFRLEYEYNCATKIQSTYRSRQQQIMFRYVKLKAKSATVIQSAMRMYIARKSFLFKLRFKRATPGSERIKIGTQLLEETKVEMKQLTKEIDLMHVAHERAEERLNHVQEELEGSKEDLKVVENELSQLNQMDELFLFQGDVNVKPVDGSSPGVNSKSDEVEGKMMKEKTQREKKKKLVEAELTNALNLVEAKKRSLHQLQDRICNLDVQRRVKERAFQSLQTRITDLVQQQKEELHAIREKSIEIEELGLASADFAQKTVQKLKANDEQSKKLYSSTQELMKFQFMSISLSYFNSLSMMQSLKDQHKENSSYVLENAMKSSSAAAALAKATGMPQLFKSKADHATVALEEKEREEIKQKAASFVYDVPKDIRKWTVDDVGSWLDYLSLSKYKKAFKVAAVDGDFLLELSFEDLRDHLQIKHPLHIDKILKSRAKFAPLTQEEEKKLDLALDELKADHRRRNAVSEGESKEAKSYLLSFATVFSQIRNNRTKIVEEALDLGFSIEKTDPHGNTGLLVACQNVNQKIAALFLKRGANINHQNTQGNTALHYALAYEPEGTLAEYLIALGANDQIPNALGLTCYDGLE